MKRILPSLILCLLLACTSNSHKKEKKEIPLASLFSGYDLKQFRQLVLAEELNEISGIAYDSNSNTLVTVNDEEGKIFFLDLLTGQIKNMLKFAGKDDYEELFYGPDALWVMVSSGRFIKVKFSNRQVKETQPISFPVPTDGEFEAAWYEAGTGKVWIACKKCKGNTPYMVGADEKADGSTSFTTINLDFSMLPAGDGKPPFRASAACINPRDGKVYMLSSPDKKILKMTTTGKVQEVIKLDPVVFKQPEGICFSSDGTLYISNEGAGGNATLLIFKPKAQQP